MEISPSVTQKQITRRQDLKKKEIGRIVDAAKLLLQNNFLCGRFL